MNDTPKKRGTIIRAENGDILGYDETGLVGVLSDRVIADIARRLPQGQDAWIDPDHLGDIDAWDLRQDGEWLTFTARLPGMQGTRRFRRLHTPDCADHDAHIIADAPGPVYGVISLGGPRRATGFAGQPQFPRHVMAPGDDVGAVGVAGVEAATLRNTLQPLPELTRDAALADEILRRRYDAHRALPLIMTRTETDSSASVADLANGQARANLITAAKSLMAAADRLNHTAVLLAIGLEFTLEDLHSDAATYRNGILDLIEALRSDMARLKLRCPPILAVFDCGTHRVNDHPVLRAQWELAWQGPDFGLHYTAPGYMFRQDQYARPDASALQHMAEMDACALEALHDGREWVCPTFLLAEREPDPAVIRVRARALTHLVIDPDNPFGAGPDCGFSLQGADNAPAITSVTIAPDDAQDILVAFDKPPTGAALTLLYAFGGRAERGGVDYPQACGAVRDDWHHDSRTGTRLHRWALPAALPVH